MLAAAEQRTLHLNVHAKWFDMISAGIKKEEYRAISIYWTKRLSKKYDTITFSNGYSRDRRQMIVEFKEIKVGWGSPEWGAPEAAVYKIRLGAILSRNFKADAEKL